MQIYNGTVVLQFDDSTTGNADSGALVTVREYNIASGTGNLADIFNIDNVQILNPLTTDSQGNYNFRAADGLYDIVIREGNANQVILPGIQLNSSEAFVKSEVQFVVDQLIYPLGLTPGSENAVIVNGVVLKSAGVDSQYAIDVSGNLVFNSPVNVNFEVWSRPVAGISNLPVLGSRAIPYQFDTLAEFLASGSVIVAGAWVELLGKNSIYDQLNALYQIVNPGLVGNASDYIIDFGATKALLMYSAPNFLNSGAANVSNFPYSFQYPSNEIETNQMLSNIAENSIGAGGSTWWVRPVVVGRKENGVDVVYRGDTYGSPENRDLVQIDGEDPVLYTNKKLGEAVIQLTKVEFGASTTYSTTGLNDNSISYREDEHHQSGVWFNNLNGQVITTWGVRNSARTQQGVNDSTSAYIKYGQNNETLSKPELQTFPSTANYGQGFFAGSTSFIFKRVGVGRWDFTRGSGGQNYLDPSQFNLESAAGLAGQFYFAISYVDKSATNDPTSSLNRSIAHFFGSPHPTNNPDNQLLYARGTYIPAGSNPGDPSRNSGGLFLSKLSDGTAIGGSTGRLDSNFVPFALTDMDVAYTPPTDYKTRLLDVQYGDTARAIIAQWPNTWDLPATMPLGTTYDLIMVEYDGTTISTTTIASNVRGDLGYNKFGSALNSSGTSNGTTGIEGTTYCFGASFYRGKDYTDLEPVIYYADRVGNDETQHRLHKVVMASDYTSVVSDTVMITQDNIIYRPEMALGGDKRILFYNDGQGWSSFNSWVANTKFIDET